MVYADGSTARSPVVWPALTEAQVAEGGTSVRITGIADRAARPVTATVWVWQTDAVEITSVAEGRVTTLAGRAPTVPATVVATFNDGSRDGGTAVPWDPVEPERYAEPGTIEVRGTVAGTTYRANGGGDGDRPALRTLRASSA
ncbi:Ig-like domain-containing protein [Streptomyces sp. NPDC012510]|uniref:Ig-like domain-containing protein n=1 Tax=Streptomyces sp. NPDC012510 TaxID=3364838 RepID=UPI0036E6981E